MQFDWGNPEQTDVYLKNRLTIFFGRLGHTPQGTDPSSLLAYRLRGRAQLQRRGFHRA